MIQASATCAMLMPFFLEISSTRLTISEVASEFTTAATRLRSTISQHCEIGNSSIPVRLATHSDLGDWASQDAAT